MIETATETTIEPITGNNIEELLPLIRQYQEFYQVENICDSKNRDFFSQFGEGSPLGCLFLFRKRDKAIAFATVYFSFASTIADKVAVLNDMYTSPEHRGQGVARQLIEHCRSFAKQQGAARLQWVTAPDNEQAQKLYDSLNVSKSTWHFYTYK